MKILTLACLPLIASAAYSLPQKRDTGAIRLRAAQSAHRAALAQADKVWREARSLAHQSYAKALAKVLAAATAGKDASVVRAIQAEQKKVAADLKTAGAVSELLAAKAAAIYKEYSWKTGDKPVRMIPATEGFCFLSGSGGAYEGAGERVRVYLKDGYW